MEVKSIQQCSTPLNTLFFSDFNTKLLQRAIRQSFKDKTGISIDYQNPDDLFAIMRVVFINNSSDHHTRVQAQVKFMNDIVIRTAMAQIQTGVAQYIGYVQDIDTAARPIDRPVNTSTTGKKIPKSNQIGM
jgi:hypothetical protein